MVVVNFKAGWLFAKKFSFSPNVLYYNCQDPFSQGYDLVSHTTHVVYVNIIHDNRYLEFKDDSEQQIFEKLFMVISFLPEIC